MMESPTPRVPFLKQPFNIQWRKALVSLPRAVPLSALKYTSSEGPHPFVFALPSARGKYSIPVYVFVPPSIDAGSAAKGLPVILDFHGGGFVLGSCLEQGPFCARMSRDLGAVVLCVDYRMGPVDKFPAAIEDGEDVLSAVLDVGAKGWRELRDAIAGRLTEDEKRAIRRGRREARREERGRRRKERKGEGFGGKLRRVASSSSFLRSGWRDGPGLHRVASSNSLMRGGWRDGGGSPALSRTASSSLLRQYAEGNGSRRDVDAVDAPTSAPKSRRARGSSADTEAATSSGNDTPTSAPKSNRAQGSSTDTEATTSSGNDTGRKKPTDGLLRPTMPSRTPSNLSTTSTDSLQESTSNLSLSNTSTDDLAPLPATAILDPTRIALSGFSSGGNLVLNLALSIPQSPASLTGRSRVHRPWPSRIPADHPGLIPLLLYYPSLDCRPLPSERPHPPGLDPGGGFWSDANDLLMPTYLPREQAAHPRASPGLTDISPALTPSITEDPDCPAVNSKPNSKAPQSESPLPSPEGQIPSGLHPSARIQLVLPELDSLSEQSEAWVEKVRAQGRGEHLVVERYAGVKHGWTQMPEGWLGGEERRSRLEAFGRSVEFCRRVWAGGEVV